MGYSRKNPHLPDGWDSGNSHRRGGQRLWKSRREGGLNLRKSSAGVILTYKWRDSNIKFGDTSALSDPENNRNILFTCFSPKINDNLSSFAGPFIAENANNKIVKNEPSQHCCNAPINSKLQHPPPPPPGQTPGIWTFEDWIVQIPAP